MITEGISGAEAILRVLRRMGVEKIFASPGSEWAPLWEFLAKPYGPDEIPEYISTRHEETAVAMATGYAKVTGKLAAVVIHTTVGSLHAAMALRAALHEKVPMVVLAGESIGFGEAPGRDPGRQWLRLLADIGGPARLMDRCVKWSFGLNLGAILPATIQRACQLAMAAPQGPTFVSVPMEFLFETMNADVPAAANHPALPVAPPEAIEALARALAEAANPVIVTEAAGRSLGAVAHLVTLAELLGAPVVETWHPEYVNFPRTHPLYGGLGRNEHLAAYLKETDLAFLCDVVSPWHPASAGPGPNARVAVLSDDPLHSHLPFWGFRTDLVLAGDVAPTLAMLVERVRNIVKPGERDMAAARWQALHRKRRDALREQADASAKGATLDTLRVVVELNAVLPKDAVIVDETITHLIDILRYMDQLQPGQFYESSYGGLGMGLGTALGVKAAAPERTVVALIGDGAFSYNPVVGSFGVCQEYGMPMLIVVFNNGLYLSQKSGIPQHYPNGYAVKSGKFVGVTISPSPDYAMIARAFDGYGEKVTQAENLRAALQRGLDAVSRGHLALIDVVLEATNPGREKQAPLRPSRP